MSLGKALNYLDDVKKISAVVLNYNNSKDSIECLFSLLASKTLPSSIVIVDNNSTDSSFLEIESCLKSLAIDFYEVTNTSFYDSLANTSKIFLFTHHLGVRIFLVSSKFNKGYAAGNNIGLKISFKEGADAAWILNNDTVVEPEALTAMKDKMFSDSAYGICGSCIFYYYDKDIVQCRGGGVTNYWTGLSKLNGNNLSRSFVFQVTEEDVESSINFIYGASVMVSRAFFEQIGGMSEDFFLYCEEQDWAYRNNGRFKLGYASRAIVFHKEGATTGWSGKKSNFRGMWLITKSRFLLFKKHVPWALPMLCCGTFYAGLRLLARRFLKYTFTRK